MASAKSKTTKAQIFNLPFEFAEWDMDIDNVKKYDKMVLKKFGHLPINIKRYGVNYTNSTVEYDFVGTKDALEEAVRLYGPTDCSNEKYIKTFLRPGDVEEGTLIK